jgi:VWFA-related protein
MRTSAAHAGTFDALGAVRHSSTITQEDDMGLRAAGRLSTALLLAALPSPALRAQAPPPVFPSGAEVVLLDLVVRDRSGRVVTDLRRDEVRVFENGVAAEIQGFRQVQVDAPSSAAVASPPSPAPAPAVSAPQPERQAVVVLVFDRLSPEGATNAGRAVAEFLSQPLPSNTWLAVYRTGDTLQPVQGFTRDRALATRAIASLTGLDREARARQGAAAEPRGPAGAVPPPTTAGGTTSDKRFKEVEDELAAYASEMDRLQKGRGAIYPLLALVRGLRGLEGRKSLLFFSEGLHVVRDSKSSLEEAFRGLLSEANRANVAIYTFSAEGLQAAVAADQARSPVDEYRPGAIDDSEAGRFVLQGNLQVLAEDTGGFHVANTNDLRPGMEKVAAELRSWYEIAYRPPVPDADGRYRRIQVKVSRPGVVVRTRSGYFARPKDAPLVLPSQLPLLAALAAPTLAHEVEHRAAALVCVDAQPQPNVVLLVEVPASGLAFTSDEAAGRYRAGASLLALVRDEQGREVARLGQDSPLEGPLAELAAARERTLRVSHALRLFPGRYRLETVVQDEGTEKLGARRTAFEVPDSGSGLATGALAMVRGEPASAQAADDPLRLGETRLVPTLGKSVPQGTPAVSFLLTVRPAPGPEPARVALELRGEGRVLGRSEDALPAPDAQGRVAYVGTLPSERLSPGRYEVWARVSQGAAERTQATSFTVAPAPAAPVAQVEPSPATNPADPAPSAPATELDGLLERAGAYAARYADSFRNVVAEELSRQWWQDGNKTESRTTRADMVFVRLPGAIPWGTFRDVFERDGHAVRPQDGRLEAIFAHPRADAVEQANAILRESTRQNLGPVYRTANVPTLALLFLLPENQRRFAFERRGRRSFDGLQGVEVAFKETSRPTIVRDRWQNDMPANGRFWVDPARGTVLRSEVAYRFLAERLDVAYVMTEYRRESGLDIFVPAEMSELYAIPNRGRIEAKSRYTKYRRFSVTVQGEAASLDGFPPGRLQDQEGVATPLATILERAGRYVQEYEETFRNFVAEEHYRQWGPDPNGGASEVARTLRSELVFVRLAPPLPWGCYRDVFEVDGQKVQDREQRLERLFFEPKQSDFARAQAIADEGARHNLGLPRNVNVPTLGLLFLRPENQKRLAFRRKGTRTVAGFPAVEIEFEERESPTLVHDSHFGDVPASGRVFVDETRGTVLRTEVDYDLETMKRRHSVETWNKGHVATEYRHEPALAAFVPDTMTEDYLFRGSGRVRAVARYTGYRRFTVSTGTSAVGPLIFPGTAKPEPSERP